MKYRARTAYAVCAVLIASALDNDSFAGGFDRFEQGIDLLFDPGRVVFDITSTSYLPSRKFDTVNGRPETVPLDQNAFWLSLNVKFVPFEDAACLAAFREPFGAETNYGSTWSQARTIVSRTLKIEELGLTCSYRVPLGSGFFRLIGGVTQDFATYHEDALRRLPNGSTIRPAIDLDGSTFGWRGGVAFEVPGRAIRASIMYYSQLAFPVQGTFWQLPLGGNALVISAPVHAAASMPQTAEAIFQFPIAPTWLNTFTVKWADWSVLTRVPVLLSANAGPLPAGRELTAYNGFFLDGWTIANAVSHKWTDNLVLALRLAWDRGVSSGWTEHTDMWSATFTALYSINKNIELIGAVAVSILTPGAIDKLAQGGSYNATFDTDTAIAARFGLRTRI